jgi:hypothetical protein
MHKTFNPFFWGLACLLPKTLLSWSLLSWSLLSWSLLSGTVLAADPAPGIPAAGPQSPLEQRFLSAPVQITIGMP